MKITKRNLRRLIREAFGDMPGTPPAYDPAKARAFNDPTTYPAEILEITNKLKRDMKLPDPSARHSQSGRADPPDYALANALNIIQDMAHGLQEYFEKEQK